MGVELSPGPVADPAMEPAPEGSVVEGQQIEWAEGPATVDLGEDLPQISIGNACLLAGSEDTPELMALFGNPPSDYEVGTIVPKSEAKKSIILEYFPEGYIKDEKKDEIDAVAILKSCQEGTEEFNKQRAEMGVPGVHISGWYEKPSYDEKTHNL